MSAEPSNVERRILDQLAAMSVEYEVVPCDPALADTASFCRHYGYPLQSSANTIVVAERKEPGKACACVVLAHTRLDVNRKVCEVLGVRRASFAGPEQTIELTGMMIGGVTPFALPFSLPILVDALVLEQPWVIIGGGSRSMKLRVAPSALLALPTARSIDGLAMVAGAMES